MYVCSMRSVMCVHGILSFETVPLNFMLYLVSFQGIQCGSFVDEATFRRAGKDKMTLHQYNLSAEIPASNPVYMHEEKTYRCVQCEVQYQDRAQYQHHKAHCNLTKYICGQCGREYRSQIGRDKHRITVHEHSQKYQCTECDKKFHTKSHFDGHMNVHKKLRPYKCHMCGAAFSYRFTLTHHMKTKCKYNMPR